MANEGGMFGVKKVMSKEGITSWTNNRGNSFNTQFGAAADGLITSNGFLAGVLIAGSILSSLPTPNSELNSNNQQMADIRGGASQALLSSGNPYAMAAGAAVMAIDKTGGFTDASQGLGSSTDTLNKVAALTIPGAGWFTGKTESYKMSDDMVSMSSSYDGSVKDAQTTMQNAGAKIMFGRKKAANMIADAKTKDSLISGIKNDAQDDILALQSMLLNTMLGNQFALQGGYQQGLARAAKKGGIIDKINKARTTFKSLDFEEPQLKTIVSFKSDEENENFFTEIFKLGGELTPSLKTIEEDDDFFDSIFKEIPEFQKGGEVNVIPEGALHARKHNMEGSEHLTKKGIPVVSEGEGGLLEQQAEIEVNEIIFRLDVTKKLEDLYNKFKECESKSEKDNLAIEAGKILTCEIMENTEDRTGLIQQVV